MTSYLALSSSGQRLQRNFPFNTQAGSVKPTVRSDGSALVVGDRWWDTTLNLEFFWNGTYWLSAVQQSVRSISTATISGAINVQAIPVEGSRFNFYFEYLQLFSRFSAAQDSSNYWRVRLYNQNSPLASVSWLGFNPDTYAVSANNFGGVCFTANTHYDAAVFSTAAGIAIQLEPVGTAGTLSTTTALITYFRYAKS